MYPPGYFYGLCRREGTACDHRPRVGEHLPGGLLRESEQRVSLGVAVARDEPGAGVNLGDLLYQPCNLGRRKLVSAQRSRNLGEERAGADQGFDALVRQPAESFAFFDVLPEHRQNLLQDLIDDAGCIDRCHFVISCSVRAVGPPGGLRVAN